ncbi:bacteriophage tail protein [Acetobacter nitrogenifigens DSM 23921 = NBRC 105050]|uniref:Tail protein n=1 Tax=Acetobacter nitrogenifigens DSM 23921 = NBRC 105050 TaxID=1120919 RepID=A0A511X5C6_9PROT|nr:tail protein [Acetobacter nitrogenifigens]GBQ92074.1 bacteriophage tail protein [Acetobacter nitrogenifigens DSM 23921 = NBRC 105050]GEN58134.1 tail protein [Acetobacter nitrogenifigens DSM 23921 = NBRC 105050]
MSGVLSQISALLGYSASSSQTVVVRIGDQLIYGWTSVAIRLGLELMPSTADLTITETSPVTGTLQNVSPGDAAELYIGLDQLITGYVVAVIDTESAESHDIHVQIASKSMDLVDCAAEFSTYQMTSTNALAIAQKVAEPFGISVSSIGGAGDVNIQQFSVILTETAYEVIERLCRLAGCLFYDLPDGNIVLAPVGSDLMASGFTMGENVEQRQHVRSMAGRYSTITAILASNIMLFDPPSSDGKQVDQMKAITAPGNAVVTDLDITRWRPLLIPVENGDADYKMARTRVLWEVARRAGRSRQITVTCDSWRDSAGALWRPNKLAPYTDGNGVSTNYVMGEITLTQNPGGTRADVTLMPRQAFIPEPLLLPMASNEAVRAANS